MEPEGLRVEGEQSNDDAEDDKRDHFPQWQYRRPQPNALGSAFVCVVLIVILMVSLLVLIDIVFPDWEEESVVGRDWEVHDDVWMLSTPQSNGSLLEVSFSTVILSIEPGDRITVDKFHANDLYTGTRTYTSCYTDYGYNGEPYTTCYDVSYYLIGLQTVAGRLDLQIIGDADFVEDCFREDCTMVTEVSVLRSDSILVVLRDYQVLSDQGSEGMVG